jgi:small subunit ribosomal protein S4e
MGNKGRRRHEKRFAASRKRKIRRKEFVWTVKPKPGKHAGEDSVPLLVLIRDYLGLAKNARETEKIIKSREILVDGKITREPKFAVGFMDIVSIPKLGKSYRIVLDSKGRLDTQEIDEKESKFKLCRIEKKMTVKGKKTQLTLHDGRNQIVSDGKYSVGDVLKMSLPDQKILEHYELKKGAMVYITGGSQAGFIGEAQKIRRGSITRSILVSFKREGNELVAPLNYVFVIGKGESAITMK